MGIDNGELFLRIFKKEKIILEAEYDWVIVRWELRIDIKKTKNFWVERTNSLRPCLGNLQKDFLIYHEKYGSFKLTATLNCLKQKSIY